ncbi:MAG: preprotein translocase subunit YajC [Cytophagales bacterium]|nr:MAG: preprotein translocase subunit YajC [Cytophagales bacterium]
MYNLLLQAKGSGFDPISLIMFGGVFVVFYFFMIRPQQKKAKDQKKFREELKKGDKVVTIGGLHGVILSVNSDDTITIQVDRIEMKFEKSAVSLEYTKKSA